MHLRPRSFCALNSKINDERKLIFNGMLSELISIAGFLIVPGSNLNWHRAVVSIWYAPLPNTPQPLACNKNIHSDGWWISCSNSTPPSPHSDGVCGTHLVSSAEFISIWTETEDEGEKKREEIFRALSVLCDNECFVRENLSTVTVGGGNVRESYGLLAFNPCGPGPQSNWSTENVMLLHFIYLYCCLTG